MYINSFSDWAETPEPDRGRAWLPPDKVASGVHKTSLGVRRAVHKARYAT